MAQEHHQHQHQQQQQYFKNASSLSDDLEVVLRDLDYAQPQQVFEDWDLTRVTVGAGANGCVYKAVCSSCCNTSSGSISPGFLGLQSGVTYAVKEVCRSGCDRRKKFWRHLRYEVGILKYLTRRSTEAFAYDVFVKLLDCFYNDTHVYLVMEWVPEGTLRDATKAHPNGVTTTGTMTEAAAWEITHQLVTAVKILHASDIIHRDIKLENVMVKSTNPWVVKVADFGYAKFIGTPATAFLDPPLYPRRLETNGNSSNDSTSSAFGPSTPLSNTPAGTLRYLPSEVLRHFITRSYNSSSSQPRFTGRTAAKKQDVFALGVLAYYLLGGSYPFDGETKEKQYRQMLEGVTFPPQRFHPSTNNNNNSVGVSSAAKEFCRALLQADCSKRPTVEACLTLPWLKAAPSKAEIPQPYPLADETMGGELYAALRKRERELDRKYDEENGTRVPTAEDFHRMDYQQQLQQQLQQEVETATVGLPPTARRAYDNAHRCKK